MSKTHKTAVASLLFVMCITFSACHSYAQTVGGGGVSPTDIPTPYTSVPQGPSGPGIIASNNQFVPSSAAQRQTVQRTNVTTDGSGNWSVSWGTTFQSATPVVTAKAINSSGNNPISCETVTRSSSAVTGWCRQSTPTLLNLSIVTSGLTLNPFASFPATNTPVMVIGAEPTQ